MNPLSDGVQAALDLNRLLAELYAAVGEVGQALNELKPRVARMNAAIAAMSAGISDPAELARRASLIAQLFPASDAPLFLMAMMAGMTTPPSPPTSVEQAPASADEGREG